MEKSYHFAKCDKHCWVFLTPEVRAITKPCDENCRELARLVFGEVTEAEQNSSVANTED